VTSDSQKSQFIIVNLSCVIANKDQITQNWGKFRPIWTQKQNYNWFDKT